MSGHKVTINMTIVRDGKDIDIEVVGQYYPGRRAKYSHDLKYGTPWEPSEAEVIGVNIPGAVADIELTDAENDAAIELMKEKYNEDCFEDWDDRR